MALDERDFYNELPASKPASFTCTRCQRRNEYQVRRIRRTKKDRRRFEIPSQQSLVFLQSER